MPRAHSLYLNLLRAFSAVVVLLAHLSVDPFSHAVLPFNIASYGSVAVILFFVLSGYVIAFVVDTKDRTPGAFVVNRLSRLYSVVVPALILTFILDSFGKSLAPSHYADAKLLLKPPSVGGYLSSLLFVNEYQALHLHGICPGTNNPFWSLSFEATYYLLIGMALFLPRRQSIVLGLLLLCLAGRTIAALFPVWVMGYLLYRYRACFKMPSVGAWVLFSVSIVGIITAPILFKNLPKEYCGLYFPWGRGPFNRNLLKDYAVAIFVGLNLISSSTLAELLPVEGFRHEKLIQLLGEMTFPLYAIHYPVICFLTSLSPFSTSSYPHILFVFVGCVAVAVGLHHFAVPLRQGIKLLLAHRLVGKISRIEQGLRAAGDQLPLR